MTAPEFVHLHLHTHYSILDGLCQIDRLVERARELNFRSLAITDHGAMYGAVEFYTKAKEAGIKPIIGMEAYVAPGSRTERKAYGIKDASYHLTLLAANEAGYKNLIKLSSRAFLEGFYYRPRVDKEILAEHQEGIIALSGCLSGEVAKHLLAGDEEGAVRAASEYGEIFGKDHFYIEIQDNGIEEQRRLLPRFAAVSEQTGIPLVASSDVHYIRPEDAEAQDVLVCINTGKKLSDSDRMKMPTSEFYLKSAEQMRLLFKEFPEACDRTLDIAERCNVHIDFSEHHLPHIQPPDGVSESEYLETKVWAGVEERYPELTDEVRDRVRHELQVINKMNFPSYFLMVADIVNYARENGIPVGPGRGSAAGSIVAYGLKITDLDPLRYDLLFERFLNEGRNEMPDIDLDFCKERRGEVVDYIIERFGRESCAQIVTFGCLSAKSAIRDVGRVLDIPLQEVDTVAKLVPDMLKPKGGKTTIEIAMEQNPDLKELYDKDSDIHRVIDIAKTLDQVVRQTGKHAAGMLVADTEITEYCPLAKRQDDITTQYEMGILEKLGLCKVDVLGLETLTIIHRAVENIRRSRGVDVDMETIPLDDKEVFQLIARGETKGVFQLESEGFRSLLVKLQPDRFEDIIAAVAMYRPGPLGAGLVDTYIACKHGREKAEYLHPILEPILKETFGLILYQEQVQAIAQEVAKFSLSEGDLMRRAMGKKKAEIMAEYRDKFTEKAGDTTGPEIAEKIFGQIEHFADYGFNKSHSACYALIAYQTAYLKSHYPREFMAALLTSEMGDTKKVVDYIDECRRMGIEVKNPDVNESRAFFTVVEDGLRFGLGAVKGVGVKAIDAMVEEREANGAFRDICDFCERVDLHALNKGAMEALIKAGAMDSLGGHRAQLLAGLEAAMSVGSRAAKAKARNQTSLFGGGGEEVRVAVDLPEVPPLQEQEMLKLEKEVIGFYVSSHPLARHADLLRVYSTTNSQSLQNLDEGTPIAFGGMIASMRLMNTQKGDRYARLVVEDLFGTANAVVWPRTYRECQELIADDAMVFLRGKVERRREDAAGIVVDEIIPLDDAVERLSGQVRISLDSSAIDGSGFDALGDLLRAHKGDCPVYFVVQTESRHRVFLRSGRGARVKPSEILRRDVETLLGQGCLTFSPGDAA